MAPAMDGMSRTQVHRTCTPCKIKMVHAPASRAPSMSLSRESSCFKAPLSPDPICTTQSVNSEQSVGSIYNEAVQFHKAGMLVEAESKFRQALSRNKRHVRLHFCSRACISVPFGPHFVLATSSSVLLKNRSRLTCPPSSNF